VSSQQQAFANAGQPAQQATTMQKAPGDPGSSSAFPAGVNVRLGQLILECCSPDVASRPSIGEVMEVLSAQRFCFTREVDCEVVMSSLIELDVTGSVRRYWSESQPAFEFVRNEKAKADVHESDDLKEIEPSNDEPVPEGATTDDEPVPEAAAEEPVLSLNVMDVSRLAALLKDLKKVDWEEIREVGKMGVMARFARCV
jgi:hypothetical protein